MYWAAGLSVMSDVPRKPHWPIKAHAFVNAGRLDARDRSTRPFARSAMHSG
jgi:outer membrane protein insertion porin family